MYPHDVRTSDVISNQASHLGYFSYVVAEAVLDIKCSAIDSIGLSRSLFELEDYAPPSTAVPFMSGCSMNSARFCDTLRHCWAIFEAFIS